MRRWTIAAGLATAIYQVAFFAAVDRTGVALGTLVALASAPVLCGLLAREALPRGWAAATACAVAGCALLLAPGADGGQDALGVTLALVAGACYAVYTVSAKRLLNAGVSRCPFWPGRWRPARSSLRRFCQRRRRPGERPRACARGLARAGGNGAGLRPVRPRSARVPAALAGTLSLAEPLTAAALGVLVLGERPSSGGAAGAVLLATGLVLARCSSGRPAAAAISGLALST